MTNPYSNHLQDFIYGEKPVAVSKKRTIKARVLPELNVRPLKGLARVKRINANKYIIKSFSNKENHAMLLKRLKAFNDMEIAYDDELDSDPLIVKSKKELWVVSKNENGELILERSL